MISVKFQRNEFGIRALHALIFYRSDVPPGRKFADGFVIELQVVN